MYMYIPHYEKKSITENLYRLPILTCFYTSVHVFIAFLSFFKMLTRIDTYIYILMTPPPFLTLRNKINRWYITFS